MLYKSSKYIFGLKFIFFLFYARFIQCPPAALQCHLTSKLKVCLVFILLINIFQDALSSPPAALAVRVPPQSPRILFNGSHVMAGQNITVPAGSRATVVCEARYGNPPAYIEWYLGT